MGRGSHIRDERLFDTYLEKQAGDRIDPGTAEHLSDCEACAGRYEELTGFLDGIRLDAEADVDNVFPTERLRQQRFELAQRLEMSGQAARVISFPGRAAALSAVRTSPPLAARWIAVAAAAGLFVGAAVGTLYVAPWRPVAHQASTSRAVHTPEATAPAIVPVVSQQSADTLDDDSFLSELALAVDGPRCRELRTFDELTPSVINARVARIGY